MKIHATTTVTVATATKSTLENAHKLKIYLSNNESKTRRNTK